MVLSALLDFFSLASFLPLFVLLVNPGFISTNKYASLFYNTFGFTSPTWFIGTLAIAVLILTVLKNVIALWITRSKASYTFTLGSHLSSRMLSHYTQISYLRFTQLDFSKELNRIANLPIAFANNVIMPIGTLISEGLVFMLLLFCIVLYDIKVFAFLCVILVPAGLLYRMKRKSIKETSLDLKEKWPLTLKYALQVVEGLSEIRVFGKETFFKSRFIYNQRKPGEDVRAGPYNTNGNLETNRNYSSFYRVFSDSLLTSSQSKLPTNHLTSRCLRGGEFQDHTFFEPHT